MEHLRCGFALVDVLEVDQMGDGEVVGVLDEGWVARVGGAC